MSQSQFHLLYSTSSLHSRYSYYSNLAIKHSCMRNRMITLRSHHPPSSTNCLMPNTNGGSWEIAGSQLNIIINIHRDYCSNVKKFDRSKLHQLAQAEQWQHVSTAIYGTRQIPSIAYVHTSEVQFASDFF